MYNAYQHSEDLGSFTCITTNSDDIRWIVDGYAHNFPSIGSVNKITVHTEFYDNRTQHSVIRIPAIPANNRIVVIECRAYNFDPWHVAFSMDTAQFNIQGLLEPPNATYSSYNATHYLVEWMESQTLDISNVEPDIENYTVCTTYKNNSQTESIPECANTSTTQIYLPKYFFEQLVFITAWNVVGESNSSAQLVIEMCNITEFSMAGGMSVNACNCDNYNDLHQCYFSIIIIIGEVPLSDVDVQFGNDNATVTVLTISFSNDSKVCM